MALGLEEKQRIVSEVKSIALDALSVGVADYRGMEVADMTLLRKKARNDGIHLKVVRNTLMKKALIGTNFECLDPILSGPNIIGFAMNEPSSVARLFRDAARDSDKFEVVGLALDGRLIDANDIEIVADLPTKDESIATLMRVMKAPIGKLASTLKEVPAKLARTISAVAESKRL